jgi:Tol biopolymer transport system component
MMRVGANQGRYGNPVWSPDSQQLALSRDRRGIVLLTLSTGAEVQVPGGAGLTATAWTPDGRNLLCTDAADRVVSLLPVAPGSGEAKPAVLYETSFTKEQLRISPDGRRVAYLSNESGQNELYLAEFPAFAARQRLSTGGANFPEWSRDGKGLAYYGRGKLMWIDFEAASGRTGVPRDIARAGSPAANFALARDGRILKPERPETRQDDPFEIFVNWAAELKR